MKDFEIGMSVTVHEYPFRSSCNNDSFQYNGTVIGKKFGLILVDSDVYGKRYVHPDKIEIK